METNKLFLNSNISENTIKKNMILFFEKHVGFFVDANKITFKKEVIDGISTYIVILKDDIRRISKANGGSGVLRQKQWSIFVFNFINPTEYIKYFGTNSSRKPIVDPYKLNTFDNFEYSPQIKIYSGKNPNNLFRNSSINYLLHHFIYSKLRKKYRYLFLNSYVYSVIDVFEEEKKLANFSVFYYNSNHVFKSVPNSNKVINQKIDINKTSSIVSNVQAELEIIEKNYTDMSDLINAYNDDLSLTPITSNNFNNINSDIQNNKHFIITEGTARTGKTIIAMRLLGLYPESRFIIMNELFYNSLINIFKIEGVDFPFDRIICHTNFNKMIEWTANSKLLIIDEAQRLSESQMENVIENKDNINVLLGDNLQAINIKSDRGISCFENLLTNKRIEYTKYYFDYSIGLASNVLYSIKYLIFNEVPFNNQNINNYDINFYNDVNVFVNKYRSDETFRKHMATIYMGCSDYDTTIESFDRMHKNILHRYPYFLDKDIKEKVMITTYELISRELDSVYIYIPKTVTANEKGLHYCDTRYDKFLLNQLYVLFTRAKGEINVYCEDKSTFDYFNRRNSYIIKNDRVASSLLPEEKEKSVDLENKITERGITRLIHFTPKDNLNSIMENGIMSIDMMKKRNITYVCNDNIRLDGICDGISLSIQNPNNFLLNSFKKNYKDRKYVCLILNPALLYEITDDTGSRLAPRLYCNYNAAAQCTNRSENDFDIMFQNSFIAGPWYDSRIYRRNETFDDSETTAVQAEILFRGTIDPKYILEVKEV